MRKYVAVIAFLASFIFHTNSFAGGTESGNGGVGGSGGKIMIVSTPDKPDDL